MLSMGRRSRREGELAIVMKAEQTVRGQPIEEEARMIAAILAGDSERYHTLIRPYERSVYRMALSLMKNEADAEDVAQEAFLKGFRKLADFRGHARFSTWLISITLNEARGRLRRQGILRMESIDEAPDEGGAVTPALLRDWREIPSDVLERSEMRDLLKAAIAELGPIYREVLLLRDVEEMSIEETSVALAVTPATVKVRLHRARLMMQKILAPQLKSTNPRTKRRWLSWS